MLLDPTRVDAYASALLVAAKDDPDGPGHLLESRVREGKFKLDKAERKTMRKAHRAAMMAKYDVLNPPAFDAILADSSVQVLPFPDDVLRAAEEASFELYDENATADSDFASVLDNWSAFRDEITRWHSYAEQSYLSYRSSQV